MARVPHILIVEDQSDTAEMLTSYFQAQGYEVTSVGWGEDALDLVAETPPDLVVLDICLPDIDGYEVCRRLRSQRRTANVPIVFLTEKREREDKLRGLKLGAVDYITKPFDIRELHLRVRNVLRRTRVDRMSNAVTGLPGPSLSDERLATLLDSSDWAALSVGLRGLDGFADVYGFVARDDVMRAVALMLSHVVSEMGDSTSFVGHLDEGNLFVIIAPQNVKRVQQALTVRLEEAMSFFYPRKDWENGQKDPRAGLPRLTVRMGVLSSSQGPFSDLEELRQTLIEAQED